ncbi:MAG: cache domain-containing protein, partial [Thermodesulfovibrionales bacterium]|nr:cache domain-containing protein [Thermodesulfovibrionales bacterium]
MPSEITKQKFPFSLLFIFLLLAAGIAAAGSLYYRGESQQIQREVEERLSTVADLKVNQIADWRQERIGDATLLMHNRFLAEGIQRILENNNAASTQAFRSLMRSFIEYYHYQHIFLLDTKGRQIVLVPDNRKEIGQYALKLAFEALTKKRIILSNLHIRQDGKDIHIDLFVPVVTGKETGAHALGVMLLRIDPEKYLFPMIQSWPTPSKTAETLIVCRKDNEVVFLNELRHQKDTALTLRFPLKTSPIPAAM